MSCLLAFVLAQLRHAHPPEQDSSGHAEAGRKVQLSEHESGLRQNRTMREIMMIHQTPYLQTLPKCVAVVRVDVLVDQIYG
uniref:Putative secreted peptide n=1 Tax=Anopheles braziliensis TaxID=58242 RepID=A0A2M3ZX55_9DIPT